MTALSWREDEGFDVACLPETVVLEFVAGELSPDQAASVDEHVDSCASCRMLVRAVARGTGDAPIDDIALSPTAAELGPAPPPVLAAGLARGANVGRYVVLDVLGKGGMGVVYAAFDPELDRKVALKLLRPELGGGQAGAMRLLREGRAIAKLAHPNVVSVYDVGTHDGAVFVAMELVDGRSLDVWLQDERRTTAQVLDVFLQAGEGLLAAHAAGMVHRDFKPANVLLGKDGRARVTDFGLARFDETAEDKRGSKERLEVPLDVRLTRTGAMVGTPAYMAPEQFEGVAVDARTDQFSFAVSLYEALYGERPFAGRTVAEIFTNIVEEQVRAAPAGSSVPAWIRPVLLRGLRAKPDDRYPALGELLAALRPRRSRRRWIVAGTVLTAAAASLGAWVARPQDAPGPSCELAAAPVAAAWTAADRARIATAFAATKASDHEATLARVADNLDAYQAKLSAMFVEACTSTHIRKTQSAQLLDLRTACLNQRTEELAGLVDALASTTNPKTVQGAVQASRSLGAIDTCADTKALTDLAPRPADDAGRALVDELEGRLAKLRARRLAGEIKEIRADLEALAAATESVAYPPLRARAMFDLADVMIRLGEIDRGDAMMERSIEEAARGRDHKQVAMGYMWRVTNLGSNMGKHEQALTMADVATRANAQAGDDPKLAANILQARARILTALGRLDEAVAADKASLAIREQRTADDVLFVARGHLNLGISLLATGDEAGAETHFEAAKTTMEKVLHPNHPELVTLLHNLGELQMHRGDYATARATNERAVAIAKRAYGETNTAMIAPLNNLASIASSELRFADAERIYLESQRNAKALVAPTHPFHGVVLGDLGQTYLSLGKPDKARPALEEAIAHLEKTVGPTHDALGAPVLALARVYEGAGDRAKADAMWTRAVAFDGELYANARSWYGQALLDRGDPKRAREVLERGVTILDARGKQTPHAAMTRFRLAKARWATGTRDAKTRALVESSVAYLETQKLGDTQLLDEMRAWLAAR